MTDCPDGLVRDLLPEYAHGVLEADDAARVTAHLADCAMCREELALLGQVRAALEKGAPVIDVAAIVRALPAAPAAQPSQRRPEAQRAARGWVSRHTWHYAAAAGLVLAVGSGIVWRRGAVDPTVRLADSSHVRAAAESTAPQAAGAEEDGIMFGGGLSDLSVNDLQALLGQMDSVRTLPSVDPESMTPVIAMTEGGKTL
ncbi:MAG: zf-HC2 domain-containing protein [Gemmatimonadota bacterium]|nr:zf-HC2 domain-containing protein [Gemmatimonadota bacterium]